MTVRFHVGGGGVVCSFSVGPRLFAHSTELVLITCVACLSLSVADALMAAIDRPAGDERHPFMMRLLSFDNLLAPPIDHYCPVLAPAPAPAEGAESGGLVCQSNTSPGVEFSVADRFNGHKVRS